MGARFALGDTIEFRAGGGSESYTTRGWWAAEAWGRWAVGDDARLVLRLASPPPSDLELVADAGALLLPKRSEVRATVSVNGTEVGRWDFRPDNTPGRRELVVPRALVGDSNVVVLDFKVDRAVSPRELGASSDPRPLALSFRSLTLRVAGRP